MSVELWVRKYIPKTLDDYVWRDQNMRRKAEEWIAEGALPHILAAGLPGTGKTSLLFMLLNVLDVPNDDILFIPASRERKVDDIQEKIGNFINMWALGPSGIKYVFLDECLAETESILMADGSTRTLKDLENFSPHNVKSFNMTTGETEDDVAYIVSRKRDEVFETTLMDGRSIITTADHPFLVLDEHDTFVERRLKYLVEGGCILTINGAAKISNIKPIGVQNIVNLNVQRNHTFITANGIPTHNCDAITPLAQKMLRTDMEQYSDMTRVIATANYKNKMIPALQSRFHVIDFQTMDQTDFLTRVCEILINEGVDIDPDIIDCYVRATYPDLRKCISLVQHNTVGNVLQRPGSSDNNTQDYVLNMVQLFKQKKFLEARKLIVSQAQPEEYPELFKTFYSNLDWFGSTQDQQDDALLAIRDAVVALPMVGDPEILLAACLVQLTGIANSK